MGKRKRISLLKGVQAMGITIVAIDVISGWGTGVLVIGVVLTLAVGFGNMIWSRQLYKKAGEIEKGEEGSRQRLKDDIEGYEMASKARIEAEERRSLSKIENAKEARAKTDYIWEQFGGIYVYKKAVFKMPGDKQNYDYSRVFPSSVPVCANPECNGEVLVEVGGETTCPECKTKYSSEPLTRFCMKEYDAYVKEVKALAEGYGKTD